MHIFFQWFFMEWNVLLGLRNSSKRWILPIIRSWDSWPIIVVSTMSNLDLLSTVKSKVLRLFGPIKRSKMGRSKMWLEGAVEGKRNEGKPKKLWWDNLVTTRPRWLECYQQRSWLMENTLSCLFAICRSRRQRTMVISFLKLSFSKTPRANERL